MSAIDPGVTGRKLLPAKQVWQRYGVVSRTLDRWLADEEIGFPRPTMVTRGRRYWDETLLVKWERRRAASKR
jgi:predicted DNA-binding transcriptional regulator AlpA